MLLANCRWESRLIGRRCWINLAARCPNRPLKLIDRPMLLADSRLAWDVDVPAKLESRKPVNRTGNLKPPAVSANDSKPAYAVNRSEPEPYRTVQELEAVTDQNRRS